MEKLLPGRRLQTLFSVAGLAIAAALAVALPDAATNRDPVAAPEIAPAVGDYLAGRFAQHEDDWAAAADFMAGALDRDPNDLNLLRRTFLLKLGEGRIAEALPLANRIVERDQDEPIPLVLLIADDVAKGRFDQGRGRVAALPVDGLAKYLKPLLGAWLAAGRGAPAEGLAVLEPLSGTPGLSVLHALHAGKLAELARDAPLAAQWYEVAARSGANTLRTVRAVGAYYQRVGRVADARALYESFQAANPESVILEPMVRALDDPNAARPLEFRAQDGMAEALFDVASALHQEGSEEVSLVYGRVALFLQPELSLARLMIGDILSGRGRFEPAIQQYRDVAGESGLAWTAQLRAIDGLARLNRTDEAIKELEQMAAARPDRTEPLIRLGDVYRAGKRNAEAITAYDRALGRVATIEERLWPVLYGRAVVLDRAGQWERAESDLLKAIELSPDQAILLNYLGYSWADRGLQLDRARQMVTRAVELRPKDGYIIDSLGWVLFKMKDYPGAVAHLEQAIELKPLDPTINDHLGDAYWAIGRHQEAFFQWRRALQYVEDDEDLRRSIEKKLTERASLDRRAGEIPGIVN